MRVGLVGLGAMGRPIGLRLLRAGHTLGVWGRRAEAVQPLRLAGACVHATPAGLARHCEVLLTVVTAGADVEAVGFGDEGLIHGAAPGTVWVDHSTIAPETARALAARAAPRGLAMLDAPVSGGAQGAVEGTLAIMVGGPAAALERVRPLLQQIGRRIVHVGESGAGQVAKACNQMIMVACIEAVAEALRLAARSGVDPAKVQAALAGGSAASRVLEVFGTRMAARDFCAGVEARLHHKDFGILLAAAAVGGVPLPIAALVRQQLNALMAQGWGRDDTSSLLRVLEAGSQAAADG